MSPFLGDGKKCLRLQSTDAFKSWKVPISKPPSLLSAKHQGASAGVAKRKHFQDSGIKEPKFTENYLEMLLSNPFFVFLC